MQLFTKRFVKDIALIIILGASLYILTHNPITHPKPVTTKNGNWSIQLMQHPLVLGIAGHNFLVLKDNQNEIVEELHGLATNATTQEWKYIGNDKSDLLQVWKFKGPRSYIAEKSYAGIVLYEGSRDSVLHVWARGDACKNKINELHLFYPPYGVNVSGDTENSNSVAYTMSLCMELNPKRLGLITPGWGKNLLDNRAQTTGNTP